MKVLVIGAGMAGTAAAWKASKGSQVTVVHARAGASVLYCGALDGAAWGAHAGSPPNQETLQLMNELGCWVGGDKPVLLVTSAGQLRWARAADTMLLDVTSVAGGVVGVADLGRHGYDAHAWARALNASPWAGRSATRFEAVAGPVPVAEAARFGDYDFASLFDDDGQRRMLGDALASANKGFKGWLVPPALGLTRDGREGLQQRLGAVVGECMSPPGGVVGARFEHARDTLLKQKGIDCIEGEVNSLEHDAATQRWVANWVDREAVRQSLQADRVIVACGGLVSGGIRLGVARGSDPRSAAFELSIGFSVPMMLHGEGLDQIASLHGPNFEQLGLSALEQVGVSHEDGRLRDFPGLFAAGDVLAGRHKSALGALQSGIRAAQQALSTAG